VSSSWQTTIDAVLADLTANVAGLQGTIVHPYSPYDPQEQVAEAGERHLTMYPVAATAQDAEPYVTGPRSDLLTEVYRVGYWEDAGDESSRGISDEAAAAALFELAEEVRDRFYVHANYAIGGDGTMDTRYMGTVFPDRSGQVRWFAIGVQVRRSITGT
jgi:hypothetical protein